MSHGSAIYDRHARFISPQLVSRLHTLGFARTFVRGRGSELFDDAGRAYLDFMSGFGSLPFGYNPPAIVAEIRRVLDEEQPSFLHVSPNPEAGRLAEALAARLPPSLSISFFANSGAEAVEGALKLAYAATRRGALLYCHRAYHGLTLGALSIMGSERFRAPFPSLPGCDPVTFGSLEGIEARLRSRRYAAFVVEPIQIEAGVAMADRAWFVEVAALCKRYGTALIFDEVQTGIGRTGRLFHFEELGVVPDILVYAKALSGGLFPVGGFTTSAEWHARAYPRAQDFELHSSTFGGSALACAVARRTLELVDEARLAEVRSDGERLGERLRGLRRESRLVADVRGRGLIWGLALAPATSGVWTALTLGVPNAVAGRLLAHWIAVRLLERGFITETCVHDESVLRVEPPLDVGAQAIDRFADALSETLLENDRFASFVKDAGARLLGQWAKRAAR